MKSNWPVLWPSSSAQFFLPFRNILINFPQSPPTIGFPCLPWKIWFLIALSPAPAKERIFPLTKHRVPSAEVEQKKVLSCYLFTLIMAEKCWRHAIVRLPFQMFPWHNERSAEWQQPFCPHPWQPWQTEILLQLFLGGQQRKGKIIGTHAPWGTEIKASCFTHKTAERHFNVQVKSLPLSPLGLEPLSQPSQHPPAGISLLHICGCKTAFNFGASARVNYSVQPSIKQKLAWKVCQKLRKQH